MPNLIQIKRSLTGASPVSLANGEFAYTANGDVLYIGSNSAVVPIGGKRNPGVLTANQALVANSTSGIDKVIVANLVPTGVYANGSFGTAGQLLTSNGSTVYWNTPAPSVTGSDTQVQFNDGGNLGADAGLVFNKTTDTLTTNTVVANVLSVGSSIVANTTKLAIGTTVGLQANGTIGTAGQVLHSNGTTVYWDTDDGGVSAVSTGAGLTGGTITTSGTIAVVANDGIIANTTGLFVKPGTGVTVNATGVHIGQAVETTSDVTFRSVTATGNVALGDAYADIISIKGGVNTSIIPTANITYNLGNNTVRWNEIHAQNVHSVSGYFDGDIQISGNLTVLGTSVTINTATLAVTDSLIQLASNNTTADLLDIGFFGNYNPDGGAHEHTGLFRDATDDVYKLFEGLQEAPNNTVNTAGVGYTQSTLQAYLLAGGFTSNATHVRIAANSTINVAIIANTLTLSTALAGTSGGTGKLTVANNALLVGNSTNGYNELTLGASGYVLQSNGTALVYDILDGGTF